MGLGARIRTAAIVQVCAALSAIAGPASADFGDAGTWRSWNTASSSRFPDRNWQRYRTPEDAGWSSQGLAQAERLSQQAGSAAVFIVYDGAVLAEWGQTGRRFMCHSIRKSLLSALYGIAADAGAIDINETIGAAGIDEIQPLTKREKTAKISDLLKSRSGVYLPAAYETRSARENRPRRGSHEPGQYWYYNNWDFNTLATVYNRKAGDDLFHAFQTLIAEPLGMEDFALRHTHYHREPEISRHPAYRFRMSARDLARFGLLYLNGGRWRDRQIVPTSWISESTRAWSTIEGGGYGYMWWTEDGQLGKLGAYAAWGYGGHALFVVPEARLVLVHRADTFSDRPVRNRSIYAILEAVLKARIGPPRSDPNLVARADTLERVPNIRPYFSDTIAADPVVTGALRAAPPIAGAQTSAPAATRLQAARQATSRAASNPYDDRMPVVATLAQLAGEYGNDRMTATVGNSGDRLELDIPRRGRFGLIPLAPDAFLVEDVEAQLSFTRGTTGQVAFLTIWFDPDDPTVLEAVGSGDRP